MTTGNEADLTARARIRLAALGLFARQGFAGTSLRAIAVEAGVSHALVRHHFGSKRGLRAAVDEDVLDTFDTALDRLGGLAGGGDPLGAFGAASAQLFGTDDVRREYLRRALLEGGEVSARLFDRLLTGTRERLAELGGGAEGPAGEWAPYQVLFLVLGPMLLEPVMAPGLPKPVFASELVAERSRANQHLIDQGLLRNGPGGRAP